MAEQELIRERVKKLERLRGAGIDPYPSVARRTHTAAEIVLGLKNSTVAGRIRGLRVQGGVMFLDIVDETGKIQTVVRRDHLPQYDFFRDILDIGDFVEAGGDTFKTARGELSIEVCSLRLLVKSIRPLPDQWAGLEDVETRLRKRYLDTLFNQEVKKLFIKKAVFWDAFRAFLKKAGFLEVDMTALEAVPGGADAEPFVTHHNALDLDFYLRISLELPLKKLLVGGFEKVFEIGRVFRNEGIDREHLQDYMQCELYWAYADYKDLMRFVERMYKSVIKKVVGSLATSWQGTTIDWGQKWQKVDYVKLFKEKNNIDPTKASRDDLMKQARSLGLNIESYAGKGRLIDAIYKKTMRPYLTQPVFLVNPPVEIEPLAKRTIKNARVVHRAQVVACGTELGKGFSELNDPQDQRCRFEEQMKLRAAGDREAQQLDESFLEALEYGMPPAAGFGFSERLFAILMDKPVRETVFFPLMRPKK